MIGFLILFLHVLVSPFRTQARLEALTPPGFEARIDLSITDDWPLAQAFVIISAVAPSKP